MRLPRLNVQQLLVWAMVLFFFVAAAQPLIDTDLWWHLANGRYILAHGIPNQDVYSYTAIGHIWVVHEWLADVAFYAMNQATGVRGLIVASGVAIAAYGWLVYRGLRYGGLGAVSAVLLTVVLGLASSPSWGARPQVLNFLLTAIVITLLLEYRARPGRWIYWLIPLFVLWANLHSGYEVGVGLLALFFVGELAQTAWAGFAAARGEVPVLLWRELRRVLLVGILGLLSGFLTPAGYRTITFAVGLLASSHTQSLIVEWFSPDFHSLAGRMLLVVLLILAAGALGAIRSRRTPDLTIVLWGVVTLTMALTSQRHVPIFAAAGAPLVGAAAASLLAGLGLKPREPRVPPTAIAAVNLVLAVALSLGAIAFVGVRNTTSSIDRAVAAVEPVAATQYLLDNRLPGRLFNSYTYGGWLVWRAAPDYPVFIDGRMEVYGDQIVDEYTRTVFLSDQWQQPLDKYSVRTVMIPAGDPLRLLLAANGWQLAYKDSVALIYTR